MRSSKDENRGLLSRVVIYVCVRRKTGGHQLAPQLIGRIPVHRPAHHNQNRRMIGGGKHGSMQFRPAPVKDGCFTLGLRRRRIRVHHYPPYRSLPRSCRSLSQPWLLGGRSERTDLPADRSGSGRNRRRMGRLHLTSGSSCWSGPHCRARCLRDKCDNQNQYGKCRGGDLPPGGWACNRRQRCRSDWGCLACDRRDFASRAS